MTSDISLFNTCLYFCFFFFKQKTAYEMRISDWSSDVCSSDLMKPNARKVRRIGDGGRVVAGFAGATADAFTLFERLEKKLEQYSGQLLRASVELAKDWRTDKYLRNQIGRAHV